MAETKKYDPSKLFVGTRLIKDSNEAGSPIVDDSGEWKSGRILIQLFDTKTGENVAGKEIKTSRLKNLAWREDVNSLSTKELIDEYFSDLELKEATQTDYQTEAARSKVESAERAKDAEIAELKAELARRDQIDGEEFTNVRPVGSPEKEPSNPEQEFSNEDMIKKGATAVGSGKDDAQNPEQVATGVGEDKSSGKAKEEKESSTNKRETNVVPVKK